MYLIHTAAPSITQMCDLSRRPCALEPAVSLKAHSFVAFLKADVWTHYIKKILNVIMCEIKGF